MRNDAVYLSNRCHGQEDNVVYELAKNYGLLETNTLRYDTFPLMKSDGSTVPADLSQKLMLLVITIVEIYKDEMKEYTGSLGSFIMAKLEYLQHVSWDRLKFKPFFRYADALQTPEMKSVDPVLAYQFIEFFHKYENSIEASDTWFDTSCRGYVEYWDCAGDRLLNWKDKGYRTLFDLLMVRTDYI